MDLTIVEINPESQDFLEALGITDERAEEIVKEFKHAEIDNDTLTGIACHMSKICKHPVELLMVGTILGKKMAAHRIEEQIDEAMKKAGFNRDQE